MTQPDVIAELAIQKTRREMQGLITLALISGEMDTNDTELINEADLTRLLSVSNKTQIFVGLCINVPEDEPENVSVSFISRANGVQMYTLAQILEKQLSIAMLENKMCPCDNCRDKAIEGALAYAMSKGANQDADKSD